jgi:uncharacterized membrane protein
MLLFSDDQRYKMEEVATVALLLVNESLATVIGVFVEFVLSCFAIQRAMDACTHPPPSARRSSPGGGGAGRGGRGGGT